MLESQLGTNLLEHRKKDFYLTPAGRLLLAEGTDLLDRAERLKKTVSQTEQLLSGNLRIACSNAVAQTILPGLLLRLKKESPGIRPILFLGNARRTREMMLNREIDVALAVHEPPLAEFEHAEVLKGNFVFAQKRKGLPKLPFDGLGFITGDVGREIDKFKVEFRQRWKKDPDIQIEVQSWMAAISLTLAGFGAALVPDFLIKNNNELVTLKSPLGKTSYQLNLYYRKANNLSPAAEQFAQICKQAFSDIKR